MGFLDRIRKKKEKAKSEVTTKSNKEPVEKTKSEGIPPEEFEKSAETTYISSIIDEQKKMHKNAYSSWTPEQEEKLKRLWLEYSKNNTKKSEIIIQLAKDLKRSKKAISRRLQRLGLLETEKKHITKPEQTLDEIRTSAKENNERLYFCLNGHVRKSGNHPSSMSCHCGLTSNYVERSLQEFENHPVVKKSKGGSTNVWYDEGSSGGGGENSGGEGKSSPDKITEFTINLDNSRVGKYSNVILSWEKPKENDSKIERYKIEFKNKKEKSWQELNSKKSEIEIQLTKGSKYEFRIASENKHGTSEYSAIKEKFVTSSILDKYQQQAVSFSTENPLLVTAGPGSGKTRVVAERVKDLILNQNIEPEKILCITFTKAGEQEMIKRFENDKDLKNEGLVFPSSKIRTYHSLCRNYLGLNGSEVFTFKDKKTSKYTEDAKEWIKTYFKKDDSVLNLEGTEKIKIPIINSDEEKELNQLIDGVSAFKREELRVSDLENYLKEKSNIRNDPHINKLKNLCKYLKKYQEFLSNESKYDFDDFLFKTAFKLKEKDFKLEKKKQIKYVIIDEFQDNNFLQFKIIKELTSCENLTCVGDVNQSIYSFQGANIELFKDFKKHYSKYCQIDLKYNYRSTQQIVNATNNFLEISSEESNTNLITTNPKGTPIHIRECDVQKTEYEYFVQLITSNVNLEIQRNHVGGSKIIDFSDFVILVRTNDVRNFLKQYLVKKGIPCRTTRGPTIQYKDKKISYFIDKIIKQNELNKKSPVSELIEKLDINNTQIILKKLYLDFEDEEIAIDENFMNKIIFSHANVFKNNLGDKPISEFMLYINNPGHPKWNFINAVKISTAHSVKGEEFPYVIISNTIEKHFPLIYRERELRVPKELLKYKSNELEEIMFTKEESRLFYVAMTRAKLELFIMYSLENKNGQSSERSRFLDMLKIKTQDGEFDHKEIMGSDGVLMNNEEIEEESEGTIEEESEGTIEEELEHRHEASESIGKFFHKEIISANTTLDICSPWIRTSYLQDIINLLEKKVKIRIITWNDERNETQQNTIKLLKQIKSDNLEFNITENRVHSKIYIKDSKIAVISSANFTYQQLWVEHNTCDIYYKKKEVQECLNSFNSAWYTK